MNNNNLTFDQVVWVSLQSEGNQGSIASYDLNTLTNTLALRDCSCAPHSLSFDDKLCPSSVFTYNSPVNAIQVYAVNKERAVHRFFGHVGISCVNTFGANGNRMLVAGMQDGSISVWDTTTGDMRAHIPNAHMSSIKVIVSNTQLIVSCSRDTILVHKVEAVLQGIKAPMWELKKHRKSVSALHLGICSRRSGGGGVSGRLWSAGEDGEVWVWDMQDGTPLAHFTLPSPLTSLVVSMTETVCYASSMQGIHIIDTSGTTPSTEALIHCKDITHLALSLDERLLVSATSTTSITIWDAFTRQPLRSIDSIATGSTITNLVVTSKPFESVSIPQVGVLKRTIAENTHPLTATRLNNASSTDNNDVRGDWKSKYDALAIKYNELESLNQELHQLVKE